ncbi:MAG: hypothetical protein ABR548_00610 [Actinomycetota bacterium]|nr:hypothetical protein [Actinomycetota bacterium]
MHRHLIRICVLTLVTALAIGVPLASTGSTAPSGGTLLAQKMAVREEIDAAYRDALAKDRPAKENAVPPAGNPVELAWATGIIDDGQAPLPGTEYVIENQWQDVVAGEHVNVYAGLSLRASRGVLVVDTTAVDYSDSITPGGIYLAPEGTGSLRIIEAVGSKLIVLSASGAQFAFDVARRSLTEL